MGRAPAGTLTIKNPDKPYFPEAGISKSDVVSYYMLMRDYVLPYLEGRPFVMKRYPDGIHGKSFYQKEAPVHAPYWLTIHPIKHHESEKIVNYAVINDERSLAWAVSQGCIEVHSWLSRVSRVDYPDLIVIDLDPEPPAGFAECLTVALLFRETLNRLGLEAWPKTSGSSGIHLFMPIKPMFTFSQTTQAVKALCTVVQKAYPEGVTMERLKGKRAGKVYLDYLQNARGRTMAFPYSLRPYPYAPVSAPITWEEVSRREIETRDFTFFTMYERVKRSGDLMRGLLERQFDPGPLFSLRYS